MPPFLRVPRARLCLPALLALLFALTSMPAAQASSAKLVTRAPTVVAPGAKVTVTGSYRTSRPAKVTVQQQVGPGWKTRGKAALIGRRRRAFRVTAAASKRPGTLKLRVQVRAGKRTLASRTIRVDVRRAAAAVRPPALLPGPGSSAAAPSAPAGAAPSAPAGAAPSAPASATVTVDPGSVLSAPPADGNGELRVSGFSAAQIGDVLVAGVGAATPYGLLVRVVDRRTDGGVTVLQVKPATIMQAFPSGSSSADQLDAAVGGRAARRAASTQQVPVKAAVPCQAGVEASLDGHLDLTPIASGRLDWDAFPNPYVDLNLKVGYAASAGLKVTVSGKGECSGSFAPLPEIDLPPVTAGPVVLNLAVSLQMRATVSVQGDGSTSLVGTHSTWGRVDGRVQALGAPDLDWTAGTDRFFTVNSGGEAKVSAKVTFVPVVKVKGYQAVFMGIEPEFGPKLTVDPLGDPWWTIGLVAEAKARVGVEKFGINWDATATLYPETEWARLWDAGGPLLDEEPSTSNGGFLVAGPGGVTHVSPDGEVTDRARGVGRVSVSRDGRKIVTMTGASTLEADDDGFEVMDVDGGARRVLAVTGAYDPSFSPDGEQIIYAAAGELHVMDVDDAERRKLLSSTTSDWAPAWSPDGTKVAFIRSDRSVDTSRLAVLDLVSGLVGETPLGAPPMLVPSWSPDGSMIALTTGPTAGRPRTVWVTDGDGGNARSVYSGMVADVDFSPGGTRLAIAERILPSDRRVITTVRLSGVRERMLDAPLGWGQGLAWIPKG